MTREDLFHWEFGRHSGIPDCCIQFFVGWWCPRWRQPEHEWYASKINDAGHPAGYVPCPACLEKKTFSRLVLCESEHAGQNCCARYKQLLYGEAA